MFVGHLKSYWTYLGKCWARVTVSTSTVSNWPAKYSATSRRAEGNKLRSIKKQNKWDTDAHHWRGLLCRAGHL